MANLIEFKVAQCTENAKGGYVIKVVNETPITAEVFGMVKTVIRKKTYYIGGMPQPIPVDTVIQEDLNKFEIVERPYTANIEQEDGSVIPTVVKLKWLHLKG